MIPSRPGLYYLFHRSLSRQSWLLRLGPLLDDAQGLFISEIEAHFMSQTHILLLLLLLPHSRAQSFCSKPRSNLPASYVRSRLCIRQRELANL
jgi:hypothetical protein